MSTKLPKFELLLLGIILLSFTIWAIAKCNHTRTQALPTQQEPVSDSTSTSTPATKNELPPIEMDSATLSDSKAAPNPPPAGGSKPVVVEKSVLYVTINNLKLRKGPGLDAAVITKLPLFEKVYFMGEVTDFKQKINLGTIVTEEPWVKIQTKSGRIGWVYGAGVSFYKKKQEGVL